MLLDVLDMLHDFFHDVDAGHDGADGVHDQAMADHLLIIFRQEQSRACGRPLIPAMCTCAYVTLYHGAQEHVCSVNLGYPHCLALTAWYYSYLMG